MLHMAHEAGWHMNLDMYVPQVQAEEAMLQSRQAADHAPGMARFEEYLEW